MSRNNNDVMKMTLDEVVDEIQSLDNKIEELEEKVIVKYQRGYDDGYDARDNEVGAEE